MSRRAACCTRHVCAIAAGWCHADGGGLLLCSTRCGWSWTGYDTCARTPAAGWGAKKALLVRHLDGDWGVVVGWSCGGKAC